MRTIAQNFAREAGHLQPLPDDPFATGIALTPRVDRYGMITVKICRNSVLEPFSVVALTVVRGPLLTWQERAGQLRGWAGHHNEPDQQRCPVFTYPAACDVELELLETVTMVLVAVEGKVQRPTDHVGHDLTVLSLFSGVLIG
ncbi:hypothetical protein [Streptomyces sp. NPDC001139]